MNLLLPMIAFVALMTANAAFNPAPGAFGGVALYNPTPWQGPALVEVPTGRIAAPGIIDWSNARLLVNGVEIPFFIREGRAHWQAKLRSSAVPPRAEDLLVFWCTVPPAKWMRVDVAPGTPLSESAVERTDSALTVRYDQIEATIDARTGLLTDLRAHGEPLLAGPMTASFNHVASDSFTTTGAIGPGTFHSPSQWRGAPRVRSSPRLPPWRRRPR